MTEETLFTEALEFQDPAERVAFLDRACAGNPDLRDRLDRLLARHAKAESFLGKPAALDACGGTPTAAQSPPDPPAKVVIGPYKLVEVIGEGGMGTVWLAQQQEPVKRLVALKVIKAGMGSQQVLARFEAERQALALMDHPNIAKVLEGGATPDGRPYFVMELVKGVPITKFCDERRLTPRERLELFVPVCQAVQHAHQKGVIHRDIKPTNVLVALFDGRPVPKVIDFGLAKAAGQPLTERTLVTGLGAVVGTPEYMSPEQAVFNQLDIDTRSDVYSLGVLLYELLTGTTPLTRKRLMEEALLEVLRLVREEEPPRPSARLSSTDELPSIAANRGVEPRKLSVLIRGELDWIVMKALEKDRSRRYETANGLAIDVQRYLADEAVQACPPSAGYRLRKLARRNKAVLGTIGMIAAALVIGLGVSLWQAVEATRARDAERDARGELDKALTEARAQEKAATESARKERAAAEQARIDRARAGTYAFEAQTVVERMSRRLDAPELPKSAAMAEVRKAMLEDLLGYYAILGRPVAADPQSRYQAARVHRLAGELLRTLGRSDEAEADFRKAIDALTKLADDHPADVDYRQVLAATCASLARVLREGKRGPEAEAYYGRCLSIWTRLAAERPQSTLYPSSLVNTYKSLHTLMGPARRAEADAHVGRLLAPFEAEAAAAPENRERQFLLADALCWAAGMYYQTARRTEGAAAEDRAVILYRQLPPDPPAADDDRRDLTERYMRVAHICSERKRIPEAETAYRRALVCMVKTDADADTAGAGIEFALGRLLESDPARAADSAAAYRNALDKYRLRIAKAPTDPFLQLRVGSSANNLGQQLEKLGRNEERLALYREAVALWDKAVASNPGNHGMLLNLEVCLYNLGLTLGVLGRPAEAEPHFVREVALMERLVREQPANTEYPLRLARARTGLGDAMAGQNKWADAIALYRKAMASKAEAGAADGHYFIGGALYRKKGAMESVDAFRKAVAYDANLPDAHAALAWALAERGWELVADADAKSRNPKRALEAVSETARLGSKSALVWRCVGWVRYRAGEWAAAVEALEKSCKLANGGDHGQGIVLALSRARLAAQDQLPEPDRTKHRSEARRRYREACKSIDDQWKVRPDDVVGQAIWDFRLESRELFGETENKK